MSKLFYDIRSIHIKTSTQNYLNFIKFIYDRNLYEIINSVHKIHAYFVAVLQKTTFHATSLLIKGNIIKTFWYSQRTPQPENFWYSEIICI